MNASVYQARQELFKTMDIPMTRADMKRLELRQRFRLGVWEFSLRFLLSFRRAMDIALSISAIIFSVPIFILTALAIIIEDGWPVIYVQDRVGQNGRVFKIYKFRSMYRNADQIKDGLLSQNDSLDGVIFKIKKDPRVTNVGRFIRKYSIDEFPQFFNVLIGDLSFVGPRPPLPSEVAEYTLEDRKRLHVKPGLTCLWQIKGRSDIPFNEQVSLDLEYIHSQSLLKDVLIIIKTVPAVLLGRGAY